MCDTVIDEHFRRSLGNNYMELFDNSKNNKASSKPKVETSSISLSVDDHFAKALGDTWNKLKAGGNGDQSASDGTRGSSEEETSDDENLETNSRSYRIKRKRVGRNGRN